MNFLKKGTRSETNILAPIARNTKKAKPQLRKKWNFCILFLCTFCLIVSWVFVIETIAGSQMKDFFLLVWNLGSNLRKTYPADCQTMVLTNFCNIEMESQMSKKIPYRSPPGYFWWQNIKFHKIFYYWFYWSLVQKFLLTGFILRYFKISQKMPFWKQWNWERMQPMSSISVLNGHSGKPAWKFIWFWSTGMPETHYPII